MRFPAETRRRGDKRRENMAEGAEDSGVGARVRGGDGDELQRGMAARRFRLPTEHFG
jgi:hypothetical protein